MENLLAEIKFRITFQAANSKLIFCSYTCLHKCGPQSGPCKLCGPPVGRGWPALLYSMPYFRLSFFTCYF